MKQGLLFWQTGLKWPLMSEPRTATDPLATRSSLIRGVAQNEPERWTEFYELYRPLIRNHARRAGLSEAAASDLVQEVFLEVNQHIQGFDPAAPGSFRSWLAQRVRWRVVDWVRAEQRRPEVVLPEETGTAPLNRFAGLADLDAHWELDERLFIREAALRQVRAVVSARDYQVYDLRIIQEVSAPEVASMEDIKRDHVDLIVHRVKKKLEEIEAQIRRRLDGTEEGV